MKIMVVTARLPSRVGGGACRQFNLIKQLSTQHEFTVAAYAHPSDLPYLDDLKPYVQDIQIVQLEEPVAERHSDLYWRINAWRRSFFDPRPLRGQLPRAGSLRQAIRDLTYKTRFDLIQIHQVYMADLLPVSPAARLLDMHDILSDQERGLLLAKTKRTHRFHAWLEWKKMRALERRAIRNFEVCTVVSNENKTSFLKLSPNSNVMVVPNGVDTEYFMPRDSETGVSLVFVGSMNYHPNVDAVLWFYRDIFPMIRQKAQQAQLCVVGLNPPQKIVDLSQDSCVTITGLVPDIRPFLAKSAVVLVPLRHGSGTRLKILDAWAMGKAIVSTRKGAEGLEAKHGENILLADTPDEFARAVVSLLKNSELRECLGRAGRKLVEEKYTWEAISEKMSDAYQVALSRRGRFSA